MSGCGWRGRRRAPPTWFPPNWISLASGGYGGVFHANVAAAAGYRRGPCASNMLLVLAQDRAALAAPETAQWQALTRGNVRSTVVPGDHFTMVREPHVRGLASVLADALAPAAAAAG